ncbi:MAG: hypothetical protein Q9M92_00380 [Enterobacterales bacterium]|nr:hypothetical protein [Enterobacterales bacterium]
MAIIEAKQQMFETFCITIDEDANQYLPYLFGQQNFILVKRAVDLPNKLLKLYAQLRMADFLHILSTGREIKIS